MVKLRTLGECLIEVGDARIAPDSRVVFALLLYLALERGKRMTRTALMEMFWPDSPPAKAAHSLRQTIYQCRKLGAEIEATKTDILLRAESVECDLDGINSNGAGTAHRTLRDFLPAYRADFSEAFSEWLERQRNVAHAKIRRRLLADIAQLKARGDWEGIDSTARELLRLDPLNEEATLVLAEASAMRGNKVVALRILDKFAHDVGTEHRLQLPATVLRKRIAEQFPDGGAQTNPFVGRADAMEFLSSSLRSIRRGEGRTVLLWGDPGIGKSRLVAEFEATARFQSAQLVKVECQVSDAARPFSAFTEAVPQLLRLRGALGCSPNSLQLLQRLTSHQVERNDDTPVPEGIGDDVGNQIRRAILDLLDSVLLESPLVLIVEDVHWLDTTSWDTICMLGRWGASCRLLIALTSRTQFATNAPAEGCETVIRFAMKPLDEADSQALFRHLISSTPPILDDADREWFISVAEGNPYFLRELARHYTDTGRAHSIPASLESLLSARIRRISPSALRLLQVSALLGRQSTFERLDKVLGIQAFDLLASLEELEVLDLVASDGVHVLTKHALLADQATQLCTPATKRLIHRRIAQALEEDVLATHSAALLWTCSDHWSLAGDGNRAARLAHSCANHLLRLGLAKEAISAYEQVLSLTPNREDRQDTLHALSIAYHVSKNWRKVVEVIQTAERERNSLVSSSEHSHDENELRLLHALWNCRDQDSETLLARLLGCARAVGSPAHHRLEATARGLMIADNDLALQAMDELVQSVNDLMADDSAPIADRLCVRMIYETTRGDPNEAAAAAVALVRHYRREQNTPELLRALFNASRPLRAVGRFEEAEACLTESIELSQARELWASYMAALDNLASVHMDQDELIEAETFLSRAMEKTHEATDRGIIVSLFGMRLRLAIALGDFAKALELDATYGTLEAVDVGRGRDEVLAIRAILDVYEGRTCDAGLLATLEGSHLKARNAGKQDFPSAALFISLASAGQEVRASELYKEYKSKYRRERYPLPRHIQRLILRAFRESTAVS